jgi:soluble epoxide hydrolase/lipid-phosphate phosphatase
MNLLLPNRTFTIRTSGLKYAYIHHAPSQLHKPTLLFIHGFPATSHEWHHQIRHFLASGYGILAPDCLGYGGTAKPTTIEPYVGKNMASDIISILDHESIRTVIGIAHDWGTYLLSQLAIWYPERLEKTVFMSVPFSPPGRELEVKKINESTKRKFGYEQYGYQVFLASEGAGRTIGDHVCLLPFHFFFHFIFEGGDGAC